MRYLDASLAMKHAPKDVYTEQFQTILTRDFKNTFDWHVIQEEIVFGSGEYSDVEVRINHAIDAKTSQKMGDDFKLILFSDIAKETGLGYLYYFDENYWITINTESIKNLASSITVRRCNNTLRWIDENGSRKTHPCSIDYIIGENRDYGGGGSTVVTPFGVITVFAQLNSDTNLIKPNRRFMFGNTNSWHGYRVFGGGVSSFNNLKTMDNTTAGLLTLTMEVNYKNSDMDDLVNGIAIDQEVYGISVYPTSISGGVGQTVQLTPSVVLNGIEVSRTVSWSSSDNTKATVSSSGLVTLVAQGTCTISVNILENASVIATSNVTVGSSPVDTYQIITTPSENYVLEGETQIFNVILTKNGVDQSAIFTFAVDTGDVPIENYIFDKIDDYSFSIENLKYFLTDTVDITCTSGVYSKVLQFKLRGSW